MNVKLSFLVLISSFLVSCSKPSIAEPHFESFGNVTTYDYFSNRISALQNQVRSSFFTEASKTYLSSNTAFKYVLSASIEIEDPVSRTYFITSGQQIRNTKVDVVTSRFYAEDVTKTYTDGNYQSSVVKPSTVYGTTYTKKQTYGEVVNGAFVLVDLVNRKKLLTMSSDYFREYAVDSSVTYSILSSFYGSSQSSYYINNNVLTIRDEKAQNDYDQKATMESISQYKLASNEAYLKAMRIVEYITKDKIVLRERYSTELFMSKTFTGVRSVDYRDYETSALY